MITELPSNLSKASPVEVTYTYGTKGRVSVSAKELTSGKEASVGIERDAGLDNQGLEVFKTLLKDYQIE